MPCGEEELVNCIVLFLASKVEASEEKSAMRRGKSEKEIEELMGEY